MSCVCELKLTMDTRTLIESLSYFSGVYDSI